MLRTECEEGIVGKLVYGMMGVLLALSIGGYLVPQEKEVLPGRVLMPNVGGRVVFDHKTHMEKYGLTCAQCHHEAFAPKEADSCNACHDRTMTSFKVSCKSCHGVDFGGDFKAEHQKMSNDKLVCATCHHVSAVTLKDWNREAHSSYVSDDYFEEKAAEAAKAQLSAKDAGHAQCVDCHRREIKGDSKNCLVCHDTVDARGQFMAGKNIDKAFVSCSTCHVQEPKKLIPGSMAAYHGQCIGCHKEKGGPTDACAQCHMK